MVQPPKPFLPQSLQTSKETRRTPCHSADMYTVLTATKNGKHSRRAARKHGLLGSTPGTETAVSSVVKT